MDSSFVKPLILWYNENSRTLPWRGVRDPYRIWISEIMLQQTRVESVVDYYLRWRFRMSMRWPSVPRTDF